MVLPTEAARNLGTETAFEVLARANKLAAEGRSIINLGIGQPDFATPDNIVDAGSQALAEGKHGYTPGAGIPELREAVARDLQRRHGAEVDAESVLITPGAKPVMFFAALLMGEPGAEIMYPNPGFPIYESVIRFSGATPVPIELHESSGFTFDPDQVLSQINERTRLIILNSPANPTGGVYSRDQVERLVEGLERWPDVVILSDEIYSRILYEGLEHTSWLNYPQLRDRLIVLDGWSKTYAMTGWRLGFGVFPPDLFPFAERLAINSYSCPNAATQYAAIEALDGPQEAVDIMTTAFDEAAPGDRQGTQRRARRQLRQPARRVLRLSQRLRDRHRRAHTARAAARRGGSGCDRRNQLRTPRRGLPALQLRRVAR